MSGRLLWPDLEPEAEAEGWLPDVPTMASADVLSALRYRHTEISWNGYPARWVFVTEVQEATGAYGDAQRFDAVAVGLVPSVKYARIVYEVKVSRADWLRELKPIPDVRETLGSRDVRMDPRRARRVVASLAEGELDADGYVGAQRWYRVVGEYRKWDAALALSTEFYYAAPPKVILPDELPPEAGLIEVRLWGQSREPRARIVRAAPVRDTANPGPEFWAAVLRRAARVPQAVA